MLSRETYWQWLFLRAAAGFLVVYYPRAGNHPPPFLVNKTYTKTTQTAKTTTTKGSVRSGPPPTPELRGMGWKKKMEDRVRGAGEKKRRKRAGSLVSPNSCAGGFPSPVLPGKVDFRKRVRIGGNDFQHPDFYFMQKLFNPAPRPHSSSPF